MTETVKDIVMPNLGFDTQEAELVEWIKETGDLVQKGENIAIVESDKANVELESVATGVLLERRYEAGQVVPVGAVIGRVGPATEMAPEPPATAAPVEASPLARRIAAEHDVNLEEIEGSGPRGRIKRRDIEAYLQGRGDGGRGDGGRGNGKETAERRGDGIRALPKVRKMAREEGLDLAKVPGSGRQGAITVADLEAYRDAQEEPRPTERPAPVGSEGPGPLAERDEVREVSLSRMRQAIGRRLGESMREAPHFYVTAEVDLEMALRRLQKMPEPQPGINVLLLYVTVQALQHVPQLNAVYRDGHLYRYEPVNLAIAVAREDGLITPVLRDAGRYSLSGLAQESRALIQRARENRLQPQDLQEGTFTISNLGMVRQVDRFTAVINPPQVAILAVGAARPRPFVIDGGFHVRHTAHLTLSGDHRVVDGMDLAEFMRTFEEELDRFSQ